MAFDTHACQELDANKCVLYHTQMHETRSLKFPRTAEIKRAVAAVAQAGIVVGSVELSPTGSLRVYAMGAQPDCAANDFDEWDKRGAL